MKRGLFLLFLLSVAVFAALPASAENFIIENYKVYAKIYETRVVDIMEDITVRFTSPSHGIFRNIPLKGVDVSNIKVNNQFKVENSLRTKKVKIGDANTLVSGAQNYKISYRLKVHDTKPQIYFNIIGTEWPVSIKHVEFYIELPKEVDAEKVGLSIGKYGTKGFDGGAYFKVNKNYIEGEVSKTLQPYEGVTLRAEVLDDYFVKLPDTLNRFIYLIIAILTFVSFVTWYYVGRDDTVIPVVNFNPPKGVNSAVADLLFHEKASTSSIIALLVELAAKGYIKIDCSKNNFTLYKLKDYDGDNREEFDLMSAIFYNKIETQAKKSLYKVDISHDEMESALTKLHNKIDNQQMGVSKDDLSKSPTFYREAKAIVEDLNEKRSAYFTKSSISAINKVLMFLYMLGVGLLTLYVMMNNDVFAIYLVSIYGGMVFVVLMCAKNSTAFKIRLVYRLLLCLLASGITAFTDLLPAISDFFGGIYDFFGGIYKENIPLLIFGCGCFVVTLVCFIQLPKPNYKGQRILGQLQGLKQFIEVAEKPRLEAMVKDNPNYFYKILPYAFVLGVSDVWINQFKDIVLPPAEVFNGRIGKRSFNSFTKGVNSSTAPSLENGGITKTSSRGGGGFSGGGFGGGGGGSW